MRRTCRIRRAAILAFAVCGVMGEGDSLWAQVAPGPGPIERAGFTGGLGLGLGSLELGNEAHGTFNYDLHFGGYVSNRWALQLELWGGRHDRDDFQISNLSRGLSAQYWMEGGSVWLKAMIGASTIKTSFADVQLTDFAGAALAGSGGWVFYERGRYHIDARCRLSVGGFKDSRENAVALAFGIGVSYF